jgi:predicted transposase YbfD/YdcC
LHLVSAWATANGVSLGQVAVAEKSNEIPAIPQLLQLLEVKGALITIDAMGCQKDIAQAIVDKKADYVLTVKDNQPTLRANLEAYFGKALENDFAGMQHSSYETEDHSHGRQETRCYDIIVNPPDFNTTEWPTVKAIGMCCRERISAGQSSTEVIWVHAKKALKQLRRKSSGLLALAA